MSLKEIAVSNVYRSSPMINWDSIGFTDIKTRKDARAVWEENTPEAVSTPEHRLAGFYPGCPKEHRDRRILLEHDTIVQCLKCMKTFPYDSRHNKEWGREENYLIGGSSIGQLSGVTAPAPPTPPLTEEQLSSLGQAVHGQNFGTWIEYS